MTMKTVFLLMAQYDAQAVIPIVSVCRDYFAPLTLENRKHGRDHVDGRGNHQGYWL